MSLKSGWMLCVAALLALGSCTKLATDEFIAGSVRTGAFGDGLARTDSLVVGSYNIKYGLNLDQAIEDLRADAHLKAPDILLLQEMQPDGAERLARELGLDFVYYAASIHPEHDKPFGNAVLSRARILRHDVIVLPVESPLPVTSRIAVVAEIDTRPEPTLVVSLHTSTVAVERAVRMEQFESVRDSVMLFPGPVIIGGDFNTPNYDDVRLLRERMREFDFRHARPPVSTARLPRWQTAFDVRADLDHFFYRGLVLRSNGVDTEAQASDHLPIWAVFEWPQ